MKKSAGKYLLRMMSACLLILLAVLAVNALAGAEITVHMDKPGAVVNPMLYGVFFEDINRAGDGGLYAELVQNRSFEDNESLNAWTSSMNSTAMVTFELDKNIATQSKKYDEPENYFLKNRPR